MFQKKFIVFLSLFFIATDSFAWSWKDAVDQAFTKNPELQSRRQQVTTAELWKENSKVPFYPQIRLEGSFREFQDYTEKYRYQLLIGPTITYLISQGGKARAGVDLYKARDRQSETDVKVTSVSINSRLRQAFANAVYAKKYLNLSRRIEAQRTENVKFTKIRYDSGLEYKWVYLSSEAKRQQAELDRTKAEMNTKTALADLEVLLGQLNIQSVEQLDDSDYYTDFPTYELGQLLQNVSDNPKYQYQQYLVEESVANVDVNKGDLYPRIAAVGSFGAGSTDANRFFPYWYVGGALSMPLWQGGYYQRNVSIAKSVVEQRKFDLETTRLQIETNLQKSYQSYVIAVKQVEVSRLLVDANKDRSRVVSNQYRSGLATFVEWDTSQDAWVNAEVGLLDNMKNYYVQRALLEENMGIELKEAL